MRIKINSFGGYPVWIFRKYFSRMTSAISLSTVAALRTKKIEHYIAKFYETEETPVFKFVMLETVNRCNGKCAFCPANVHSEKRQYKKMTDALFDKIILQLREMCWSGTIFLQVNNEPFIDGRIMQFAYRIREQLPKCKICIITNGTLLNESKLQEMMSFVDTLIINDYSDKYRLSDNIRLLYRFARKNKAQFDKMEIVINRRYTEEILATRAGSAPNKSKKNNKVKAACIYPFTDLIIYPDGKVGMCCNDCYETTNFGDANVDNLLDIWRGPAFGKLREAMKTGNRENYPFCKECDVMDAGSRENILDTK